MNIQSISILSFFHSFIAEIWLSILRIHFGYTLTIPSKNETSPHSPTTNQKEDWRLLTNTPITWMSYQLYVLKAPRLCSSPTGHSLFLSRVILPRATLSWRGLHIRGSTRLQPSLRWPNVSLHPHRPGSRILYIVLRPPITDYMIDDAARSPWEMALVNAEPALRKSLKATVFDF